jgi:streptogramin lyase
MTRSTRHRTARARRRLADRVRARPRLEGLEARCLLSLTITEFSQGLANAFFGNGNDITAGPDGNLWFADYGASKIGMFNPTTHAVTEFTTPTANAGPRGITAGPDGNLWFTESTVEGKNVPGVSQVGMINPATHAISEFATPTANAGPYGITAGPDGNLWFTLFSAHMIGMINPTTHAITEFRGANLPDGICAGPDGNVWFADGGNIGMINLATHAITEFATTSLTSGIAAGPDGNIWFTEASADKIGMINLVTLQINEFPVPTASAYPVRICAGPDGNIWFSDAFAPNIAMFNPATLQAIITYPVPYANTDPWGITAGPEGIWFTDQGTKAIGLATQAPPQLVVTQQPPSSIAAGSTFGLTVTAEDSSGNPITSFNGTVTVGLENNPGCATLGGTLTATASNGVATFSGLSLTRAAIGYTLYASTGGYGWGITSAITVAPLAPSQLVISQQPSATATAGQPFATQPNVYEEDAYGNLETGDNSTVVTAALASGAGPLQGTTAVTVASGVASFTNLADDKAETLTLQFSGGGLTSVPSSSIVVSPAAATKLVITTQPPSSVVVNTGFGLVAAVEDAYGNVVTSASNSVSVALANNPTKAKLGGTTSAKASQGLVTFTGLSINKVGSGYTLQVSSSGLTSATTSPFNVVSSATSSALAATTTTSPPNPLLAPLVLDSPDLWDGLGFQKRSRLA